MSNLGNFDANLVEPSTPFEPIPAGEYKVVITGSELKPTSKGDGERLSLELQVIDGEYEGRKLFDGLNLKNPNEQAVNISKATLSAICRAVGVLTPRDSAELHNKPLLAKVVVEPRKDNGELSNKVKGYKPLTSNGTAPSAPAVTEVKKGPAPWAKK